MARHCENGAYDGFCELLLLVVHPEMDAYVEVVQVGRAGVPQDGDEAPIGVPEYRAIYTVEGEMHWPRIAQHRRQHLHPRPVLPHSIEGNVGNVAGQADRV